MKKMNMSRQAKEVGKKDCAHEVREREREREREKVNKGRESIHVITPKKTKRHAGELGGADFSKVPCSCSLAHALQPQER